MLLRCARGTSVGTYLPDALGGLMRDDDFHEP